MYPLLIIVATESYDVSRLVVDKGISCDIKHEDLFGKLGMKVGDLGMLEQNVFNITL